MNDFPQIPKRLKVSDIVSVLVIGETFAWLLMPLRKSLGVAVPSPVLFLLPVLLPLIALFLLWVFAVLGRRRPSVFQVGKYAAVGFLNTAVDFAVVNVLVLATGIVSGLKLGLLNSVSFALAVVNSYFWNKYWTFSVRREGIRGGEFAQFVIVSLVGLFLNSGFVSAVTAYLAPPFGLTPQQWVNLVKAMAIFINLVWNFSGYKFIVFRDKGPVQRPTTPESPL